ncbi:MAG TPA: diguanylate cyclase [Solirubrobacterales bacterium]|jgi:diguanylate cyclase (GGDEF)-like protein
MRKRFWIGIVAVVLVAVGSVVAAVLVYNNDRSDFHQMQRDEAIRAAHQAESVAALSIGELSGAAAFVQAEQNPTKHEFSVIGRSLLREGVLNAAAYLPRVSASERADYEREQGHPIIEKRAAGVGLQPAAERPVYFPLTYVTTYEGPLRALGYDLSVDSERGSFLRHARDSGEPVATPLVPLLLGGTGANVFHAVYRDGAPVATRAERRRALIGYTAGTFRIEDLAAVATAALPKETESQLWVDGKLAIGATGELDDAATAPIHIADRTWLLAVADPGGPGLSLPLALAVMGIALAALLASLIVSWSRRERMEELERQASEDSLTGLNNRRRFEEELAAAMARSRRHGSTGALLMIDLDEFKRINDSRGHPEGDRVIREVAAVLRRRIRESDTLARLGGDEFAVILSRCSPEEATTAAEGIARELREHRGDGEAEAITASIGIAIFGEDPRTSPATVISEADTAMYAAKDAGRDSVRVFDPLWLQEQAPEPR